MRLSNKDHHQGILLLDSAFSDDLFWFQIIILMVSGFQCFWGERISNFYHCTSRKTQLFFLQFLLRSFFILCLCLVTFELWCTKGQHTRFVCLFVSEISYLIPRVSWNCDFVNVLHNWKVINHPWFRYLLLLQTPLLFSVTCFPHAGNLFIVSYLALRLGWFRISLFLQGCPCVRENLWDFACVRVRVCFEFGCVCVTSSAGSVELLFG